MATTIVTCPNCGKRNRLALRSEGVPRCGNCHELLPWVVDATSDTYDGEVTASVPVLVDLWADWCGPCKMISPLLDELAAKHAGRLKVVRVNVDEEPQIAARHQVQGIPLLILIRGGREADRLTGAPPKPQLQAWVEGHLIAEAPAGN